MKQTVNEFVAANMADFRALLKELCHIPAPSHFEDARAAYCKKWLEGVGATGVTIDEAKNVLFPLGCEGSNEITVVVAHTDTVFPDTTPLPYREENGRIYCPGVGDDTASLCAMMFAAKYFLENGIIPPNGLLFVCNSCEEGLGNLLGTRTVMETYKGRVKQFISFDSSLDHIANVCVGSHRYEVEAKTAGGHSFGAFGNRNAALSIAEMISAIYAIKVPKKVGTKTTYNVGIIEGGTSVNTIPQSARMLCEYRSNDRECLAYMQKKFEEIFTAADCEHTKITVKKVGDRPCMGEVDPDKLQTLIDTCRRVIEETANVEVKFKPSSTDCNIPLSQGIPAVCIGTYYGAGAHTREEYIEIDSLPTGLAVGIKCLAAITGAKI